MKLFSFTCDWPSDESLCEMQGFSHRGQPYKERVFYYPFEQWKVRAYLRAKHRRDATKQLRFVPNVRDLDGGKIYKNLV